jgi:cell shape-determining protein MreC
MSYEHRSRVNNKIMPSTIKTVLIVIVSFVIIQLLFPRMLPGIFAAIASPFWGNGGTTVEDKAFGTDYQNALIKELQDENIELKNILHRSASSTSLKLAAIVKKPPLTAYDSYIIYTRGLDAKVGNKVYVSGNILVGEIVEINGVYSKVKLYSTFGEKYDVYIGKNNIQATATGRGGGSFDVIMPKESNVHEGDIVVVPDLSLSVFGIVKSINIESARAFSTVLFSQPINIFEQKWVLVDVSN